MSAEYWHAQAVKLAAERDEARRKNENVIASELQAIRDRSEARAVLAEALVERDAARNERDHYRHKANRMENERDAALRERNEARAELAHLSSVMDREDGEAWRLEQERDEAQADLAEIQEERSGICKCCGKTKELRQCRECYNAAHQDAAIAQSERDEARALLRQIREHELAGPDLHGAGWSAAITALIGDFQKHIGDKRATTEGG
jgi:chromosome segregation ATPase